MLSLVSALAPIVIVLILLILLTCVKVVPEAKCYVVEFLGTFKAKWEPGLHFKIPFLEKVAKKVSLKEQVADFPPQPVITKDNVTMNIDTVVYFKIYDPKLFTYGVEQPIVALENLTATSLRNIVGDLELDQTLTSRDLINEKMRDVLDKATDPWGIKVNRVELKNIIPPKEIQQAMEKQMKAERDKRQTLLEADAHKQSAITRAEGDKAAKVLAAQAEQEARIALAIGEAESIRKIYEAEAAGLERLKAVGIDSSVLALKQLEALKEISDGRATKIFMPTELTQAASKLGFAAEILGTGAAEPIDKSPKEKVEKVKADACCDPEVKPQRTQVTRELVRTQPEKPEEN
ncbi:MAG: SPFH domain-containing protein [Candidatus Limivivens sp.]|nr:SPFH domain-containing protein [Candidatus Limivivens sp.]